MLTKMVATLALLATSIGCTIGAFMLGWGLRPASWFWIVLFAGAHVILVFVIQAVLKEGD